MMLRGGIGNWFELASRGPALGNGFSPVATLRCSRMVVALASFCLVVIGSAAWAQDTQDDPVVAQVDGAQIRESDLALADRDLGPSARPKDAGERRQQLLTYMTDMILAERLGEAEGISDSVEFRRRYALMRRKLLMEMLLDKATRQAQTDAALHAAYDQLAAAIGAQPDIHTLHILFKVESAVPNADKAAHERAVETVRRLRNGDDLAALQADLSHDPAAQAVVGEVGFGVPVPSREYAEAAQKLGVGEVSDPVKSAAGWYVIKLDKSHPQSVPTFEAMKEQLGGYVARNAQLEFLKRLRANAHVER